LVVKETPFLVAVGLAALRQFPARAQLQAALSLGYAPATAFALVVAPQLYRRIRLPVFAVLAYSLSVVDMALVLAPSHPAPLALLSLRWLVSPQLDDVFPGEAAAALQLALVVAAFALWRLGESLAGALVDARARRGGRRGLATAALPALSGLGGALLALGL